MTKHTMAIPNWIWEWAQQKYNVENPSSYLRDLLSELIADLKNQATTTSKNNRSQNNEEEEGNDIDQGTIFEARRAGICFKCKKIFPAGETIFVQKGRYKHIDCRNKELE